MNRKLLNDREKIPMILKEKIKKIYIYVSNIGETGYEIISKL